MPTRIHAAALVLAALSATLPVTASAQEIFLPRDAYVHGHGRYGNDGAYYGYGRYRPDNGSFYERGVTDFQTRPSGPTVGDR
jgi:hypothetical protein